MIDTLATAAIRLPDWCVAFDSAAAASGTSALRADVNGCAETVTLGDGRRVQVVFDGYLFDRPSLTRAIGIPVGAADAHVVAAAYGRWGERVFDELDGCYLLAIHDPAAGQLFLGNDALGRHPVFYARRARHLWFGADVRALARRLGAGPLNRRSLALGALLFWPEAGETFLDGISRLPPGHHLSVDAGLEVARRRYWEPMPADEEPWVSDAEAHERFEPELVAAGRRRLALDPHGIMLSGGVDSVTIAALAADERRSHDEPPIVAVSARTGDELTGEERTQDAVAKALGMPHVINNTREWLAGEDRVEVSLAVTPTLPAPTRIWWVGSYMRFYRRTADQGLQTLLTGAGGDNWLGVADAYAADLIRQGNLRQLRRFVRADMATGGASWASAARRLLWAGGLRPVLAGSWELLAPQSKLRFHRRRWENRLPPWLAPDPALRAELLERLAARRTPDLTPDGRRPASYYRHSLRVLENPYLHHENENAFHVERMCGLRLLSPYHDRRLVSFLNRISPATLIFGDRYKGLLRPVVARRLPGLGLEEQRKDYPAHLEAARLAELRASMEAAWRPRPLDRLASLGVVDPGRLSRASTHWSRMTYEELAVRFFLLSAERWLADATP